MPSDIDNPTSSTDTPVSTASKKPGVSGCQATLLIAVCIGGALAVKGYWELQKAFESARQASCSENMKDLVCALHKYRESHRRFPPPYTVDEEGNRLHSWRVLILPYLGEKDLYEQIRLDEPWDSPHNRQFVPKMPFCFHCPSNRNRESTDGFTDYVMVTGPGTVGDGDRGTSFPQIKDGASNTICVVEMSAAEINWMEPRDYDITTMRLAIIPPGEPFAQHAISSYHPEKAGVALCDGSVTRIAVGTDPELLKGLFTIDGGEDVSWLHNR